MSKVPRTTTHSLKLIACMCPTIQGILCQVDILESPRQPTLPSPNNFRAQAAGKRADSAIHGFWDVE